MRLSRKEGKVEECSEEVGCCRRMGWDGITGEGKKEQKIHDDLEASRNLPATQKKLSTYAR